MAFDGTLTDRLALKVFEEETEINPVDWADNWLTLDNAPGVLAPSGHTLPAAWGAAQRGMLAVPRDWWLGLRHVVAWRGSSPRMVASNNLRWPGSLGSRHLGWPYAVLGGSTEVRLAAAGVSFLRDQWVRVTLCGGLFTQAVYGNAAGPALDDAPLATLSLVAFGPDGRKSPTTSVTQGVAGRVGKEASASFLVQIPKPEATASVGSFSNFSATSSPPGDWGKDDPLLLIVNVRLSVVPTGFPFLLLWTGEDADYASLTKPAPSTNGSSVPWSSSLIDAFIQQDIPLSSVVPPVTLRVEAA